ncbi:MAG: hypothetical protein AAB019_09645 [Planctomycetota bacterium]
MHSFLIRDKAIILGFLTGIFLTIIGLILIQAGGWGPCGPDTNISSIGGIIVSIGMKSVFILDLDSQFPVNIIMVFVIQGLLCSFIGYGLILAGNINKLIKKNGSRSFWFIVIIVVIFGIISRIHYWISNP